MALSNFERMIQLAENVFASKSNPDQLDVNEDVIKQLKRIHPATVSEHNDGNGPVVWILVIPTTSEVMNKFIDGHISEGELLKQTPLDAPYNALYLCSAMVLDEYRGKGLAKKLTCQAIESIRKQHNIKTLFVWPFSKEGDALAQNIAQTTTLPLLKRKPRAV